MEIGTAINLSSIKDDKHRPRASSWLTADNDAPTLPEPDSGPVSPKAKNQHHHKNKR